jgi:hypothetical protein
MRKIVLGILIFVVLVIISQSFTIFQFNFVKGGGNLSSSATKAESIKRGVYICDVRVAYYNNKLDSAAFKVDEAWVEKIWRDGVWYWTTQPEDFGYRIKLKTPLSESKLSQLEFMNDRYSALGDYEGLGCCCGECGGTVRELPPSDTIAYNILKDHIPNFDSSNIVGQLVLVLER